MRKPNASINLRAVERLARKRFGKDAVDILAGTSAGSFSLILRDMPPPPPREVPTVVVPRASPEVEVGRMPTVSEQPDPVRDFFARLEATRPDLFN